LEINFPLHTKNGCRRQESASPWGVNVGTDDIDGEVFEDCPSTMNTSLSSLDHSLFEKQKPQCAKRDQVKSEEDRNCSEK